nr:DUF6520 family protein [uncultured Flavobacterium sp.]
MKINFKQALLPLAVMIFGAAAAFATNAVKQSVKADELAMFGYHYVASNPVGSKCEPLWVPCNPSGSLICTIDDTTYYRFPEGTGLQCVETLYLD